MKNTRFLLPLVLLAALSAQSATSLKSGDFAVDLRESPRVSTETEILTYSTRWAGTDALSGCTRKALLSVSGYAGTETISGVPVLVRLSPAIPGFDYDGFADPATGADLVFCNEAETVVFPHEIDEWNTNGESLVWVRLPELATGTAFKMGYGGVPESASASAASAHAVWADYVGVWHMNEDSGTAFDSTANGFDAQPEAGTNALSDISQMVACEQGAVGRARVNATQLVTCGNHLTVPNYDVCNLGDTFVVSGWFHADVEEQRSPKMFYRGWGGNSGGWGCDFYTVVSRVHILGGGGNASPSAYISKARLHSSPAAAWTWICIAYHGTSASLYQDGVLVTNGTIVAASDNGSALGIGSVVGGIGSNSHAFVGQYDEIRLRGGAISSDRIRADYDMVANSGFVTVGAVETAVSVTAEIRHDGEVFASNLAGEGTVDWTPSAPGTYEFRHVSLLGNEVVAEETATFVVPGTVAGDLFILAEGGLVPGVSIQLGGAMDGWTIHYTTDGSEPTVDSPIYTGPFTLVESATVKVVAISDAHGWTSGVAEKRFDLATPLAVTGVTARQRYPWNGKVDIDVSFTGRAGESYRIELSALDEAGGTNLPVRTVWLEGSPDAVGNPVPVPASGTHRLVWNADADLPVGFVADRVIVSARLLNPIWSFESIPAIDPDDEWAPETVYHDVQTVVSYGEIENHAPTVRCLTDEWNLEASLGANVVFSGSSMGLRRVDDAMRRRGVLLPIALWTHSDSTNAYRLVTMDYETGVVAYDLAFAFSIPGSDLRFLQMRDGAGRIHADLCRDEAGDIFLKSSTTDRCMATMDSRFADGVHGSAVCGYFPRGIPWSDSSSTSTSSFGSATNAAVFLSGTAGTDMKQAIVGLLGPVQTTSKYSCMKNPTGRYVVPMLDGTNFLTVGHGSSDPNALPFLRVFTGTFNQRNGELFDLGSRYRLDWPIDYDQWTLAEKESRVQNWTREPSLAYSKGVAMPDGRSIFLGGAGRDFDGTRRMWQAMSDVAAHADYPVGHPFESWARRDVTCLLPNGKYCGVDEELGLVVVNPLTGETYVASDDPAFKKGKMGCQLLPNGKVWIIPYDCEGREFAAGTNLCGKLYEVDFGFTRSFSLSSLMSPYLKVAEGDPEPSGIKVGLDPNGGELPGIYAQYYKGEDPVYGELPAPTREGYAFLGWSTDGSSTNIVSATDPVPASGIQLKAAWTQDVLTSGRYMIVDLESFLVTYEDDESKDYNTDEFKTSKMVFRRIPAGTYSIPVPSDNEYSDLLGADYSGMPFLEVSAGKEFFIGLFEVTESQFSRLRGNTNPTTSLLPQTGESRATIRGGSMASNPVTSNTNRPCGMLNALSKLADGTPVHGFDLPTGFMWEIACQSGSTTLAPSDNDHTWNRNNSNQTLHSVGRKLPNNWGFFDMLGNAAELILDDYNACRYATARTDALSPYNEGGSANWRHACGGTFYTPKPGCRGWWDVFGSSSIVGFRLSRIGE